MPEVLASKGWVISAWTQNEAGEMDVIMGIRHQAHAIEGVQFHPESVLTQHGEQMLANFLQGQLDAGQSWMGLAVGQQALQVDHRSVGSGNVVGHD